MIRCLYSMIYLCDIYIYIYDIKSQKYTTKLSEKMCVFRFKLLWKFARSSDVATSLPLREVSLRIFYCHPVYDLSAMNYVGAMFLYEYVTDWRDSRKRFKSRDWWNVISLYIFSLNETGIVSLEFDLKNQMILSDTRDCKQASAKNFVNLQSAYSCILGKHECRYVANFKHTCSRYETEKLFKMRRLLYFFS